MTNGIPVWIVPAGRADVSSVCIVVARGSRHESARTHGFTHLLEHLLLAGGSTTPSPASEIERVGGDVNAITSKEYLLLHARVPRSDIIGAISTLAAAIASPIGSRRRLGAERSVVIEELRSAASDPGDAVQDLFFEAAFPNHGLGRPVAGTEADVQRASVARVEAFRKLYFDARATGIVVVGADRRLSMEALERSPLASLATVDLPTEPGAPSSPPRLLAQATRVGDYAYLMLGGRAAEYTSALRPAMDVVATAIGGWAGALLQRELRTRRGLAYDVSAWHTPYVDTGALRVRVGTTASNADRVSDLMTTLVRRCAKRGFSEVEVEAARRNASGQILLAAEAALDLGVVLALNRCVGGLKGWTPWAHARAVGSMGRDQVNEALRISLASPIIAIA
jgi:predicted Zn-dependent peptidase